MKLYTFPMAPNALRVHIFLSEKGLKVPLEHVDAMNKATRHEPFLSKNSLGEIPVLELEDGTLITESVAICRYFEDTHPEPRLMGATPVEAARVEMWNRRMEQQIMGPIGQVGLHTHEFFADITGIAALHIGDMFGAEVPPDLPNAKRWEKAVRSRPTWSRKAA